MVDVFDCYGNWIFFGFDGIKLFFCYELCEVSYFGYIIFLFECISDVKYVWRVFWWSVNLFVKSGWVGVIGWNVWFYNDWWFLKSGY